jgi:hypothetical protein
MMRPPPADKHQVKYSHSQKMNLFGIPVLK